MDLVRLGEHWSNGFYCATMQLSEAWLTSLKLRDKILFYKLEFELKIGIILISLPYSMCCNCMWKYGP